MIHRRLYLAALLLGAVALSAGCTPGEVDSSESNAVPTASASPTADLTTYFSPDELVDAFRSSGGICPTPRAVKSVSGAPESETHAVTCLDTSKQDSESYLLAVFNSNESLNGYLATVGDTPHDIVIGDRWAVVGTEASAMADDLGGKLIN